MTRSATGQIRLQTKATLKNSLADGTIAQTVVGGNIITDSLEDGVEEGEINRAWQEKSIQITAGNFVSRNLQTMAGVDIGAGVGNDALGQPLFIEEVVLLFIRNKSGDGILEINPATNAPAAAKIAWIPNDTAADAVGGGLRQGAGILWYEPGDEGLDLDSVSSVIHLQAVGGDVEAEIYVYGRNDDDDSSSSSVSSSSKSTSSLSSTTA